MQGQPAKTGRLTRWEKMAGKAAARDLSAEFKAERIQQIADIRAGREASIEAAAKMRADFQDRVDNGKVRDNGDGTFTVTDPDSWDNNETWSVQTVPNVGALVLPVSNLDESTGTAALYTRTPAWHGLGNVVPEGTSDLSEVLRLGGIDFEVSSVPTLFERPAYRDADGEIIPAGIEQIANSFTTVRSGQDGVAPAALGVVGKVYKAIQNYDAGAFLQDLVRDHGLVFESAGATFGGKHVFVGMRLPDDILIDIGAGQQEVVRAYLYWLNSHDGTTSASITVSPWAVACGNTERFNLRDAVARWRTRHTTYAMTDARMQEARRTLGKTVAYFRDFKEEEESLARTKLAINEFLATSAELFPLAADPTDRQRKTADDRTGTLLGMFGKQSGETGRTAWSAERAYTDYLDHVAPKRVTEDRMAAARATAIIEGTDDEIKSSVHSRLMQFVK